MKAGYGGGHLGDRLEEYVDGVMPAHEARQAARHLVVCESCRRDVAAERDILARLREVRVDPARHASLVEGLLALAPPCPPSTAAAPGAPAVREAPKRVTCGPALVGVQAPPQYRRERRVPVLGVIAMAAACVGAVVITQAKPQRFAPAAPQSAHGAQAQHDDVGAPTVAVAVADRRPAYPAGFEVMRPKRDPSGRIGP